jgi:multimeric flavodoxin WrbA
MKKVTAFVGSTRKGNTYNAAAQFLNNLQSMGDVETEIARLGDYHLEPCRGCRVCFDRGEEHCPAKDDRDLLIEKMRAADGLVFASPNYSFQVSAHMKLFLDRLAFAFHRPEFYGKTYTSIVTQGIGRGDKIVDYLDFVGMALCCNTVKGSCLNMLLPITAKQQRKIDAVLAEQARRYYATLQGPAYPAPSLINLAIFRFGRMKMKLEREQDSRDYAYYADKGWFASDYWYPTRLGLLQRGAGSLVDSLAARMSRARTNA